MANNTELNKRLTGDDYETAKDRLEFVISCGGFVDQYGNVRVYHRTSEEKVKEIQKTKRMLSKEEAICFSTEKNGQAIGYGNVALEFLIPVEKLVEDDIFPDKNGNFVEIHFRLPMFGKKVLDVSEYLC